MTQLFKGAFPLYVGHKYLRVAALALSFPNDKYLSKASSARRWMGAIVWILKLFYYAAL